MDVTNPVKDNILNWRRYNMNTRKKYSKEFKLDAISLVLEQGYSRAEAARSLGINANMLCRWIKERGSTPFLRTFLKRPNTQDRAWPLFAASADCENAQCNRTRLTWRYPACGISFGLRAPA